MHPSASHAHILFKSSSFFYIGYMFEHISEKALKAIRANTCPNLDYALDRAVCRCAPLEYIRHVEPVETMRAYTDSF